MSEWTLWGYKAHLVLEDENGAFEVLEPLKSSMGDGIRIDADKVLRATQERTVKSPPRYREVKFDVS